METEFHLDTPPVEGFSEGPDEPEVHPVNQGIALVDLLKQDAAEVASPSDVYIPVKGYERTGLAIRYRVPESGRILDQIATKVNREYKTPYERNLYMGIDSMIVCCVGIYVRSAEAATEDNIEGWVELNPDNTGEALTFGDLKLAELFGFGETKTARTFVKKIFGNNDIAINDHAARLNRWLIDTNVDINASLWNLGE